MVFLTHANTESITLRRCYHNHSKTNEEGVVRGSIPGLSDYIMIIGALDSDMLYYLY